MTCVLLIKKRSFSYENVITCLGNFLVLEGSLKEGNKDSMFWVDSLKLQLIILDWKKQLKESNLSNQFPSFLLFSSCLVIINTLLLDKIEGLFKLVSGLTSTGFGSVFGSGLIQLKKLIY